MYDADICEIVSIPTDSSKAPDIQQIKADSPDAVIDRARMVSRNSYAREVLAVINGLQLARFAGRYWLDNPDGLPKP